MTAIKFLSETKDTVTLRRADFKNLIDAAEMAEDLAAIAAHRAYESRVGWDVARRNYLTGEETRRLLDGESPVRVWREKRGLAQRSLAEAAKISPSYLAEIELGKKPGSADALRRIAALLEVPIENLSEHRAEASPTAAGPVTRSNLAAARLMKLAESGVDSDEVAEETRVIVAHWLKTADKEGVRHQVRAAIETLRSILRDISESWIPVAVNQDRIKNIGAAKRLQRASAALEAAIDVLGGEVRRL